MNLEQCYLALGGDYNDVLGRLRKPEFIKKFVLKFLDDKSYDLLLTSMESGDRDAAFRAAHTMKGVCSNLSFSALYSSSSELTEALRNNLDVDYTALIENLKRDYIRVVDAIKKLDA